MKMTTRHIALLFFFVSAIVDCQAQEAPDIKLRNFRPRSIYRIPVNPVPKAKFGAIDMHSHDYAKTDEEVAQWVKTMDAANIR
ncbi:MAG TPA: hypothetical protein VF490_03075, partial [Chryseosolibacter sp.]